MGEKHGRLWRWQAFKTQIGGNLSDKLVHGCDDYSRFGVAIFVAARIRLNVEPVTSYLGGYVSASENFILKSN